MPKRGVFERDTIDGIIDEAPIGQVGFVAGGFPYVIPMVVVRNGDDLLLHGATASRLIRHLTATSKYACRTFTSTASSLLGRYSISR